MLRLNESRFPPPLSKLQKFVDYQSDCRRMLLEDMAIVSVKMEAAVYQRSRRAIRVTFQEKVADFGTIESQCCHTTRPDITPPPLVSSVHT